MTSVELMQEFNRLAGDRYRLYDINDRLNPIDVEGYLNKAKDRILVEKFLSYNTPYENILALQQSYDEIHDLVSIDSDVSITGATGALGNYTQKIDANTFPSDYFYYVFSSSKITRSTVAPATNEWVGNKEINYSSLLKAISGVHNWPIIRQPLVYFNEDNLYIIRDAYTTISDINLAYLRQPDKIDVFNDTEVDMPEHWHPTIAEMAISIYLKNIFSGTESKNQDELPSLGGSVDS